MLLLLFAQHAERAVLSPGKGETRIDSPLSTAGLGSWLSTTASTGWLSIPAMRITVPEVRGGGGGYV